MFIHFYAYFDFFFDFFYGSCGTYTPWNITQPLKRIHLNQF